MSQTTERDRLVALRRDLHQRPELGWREFYTTARIVEELEAIGVDELYVGPDAIADERRDVPDEGEIEAAMARAREAGIDETTLAHLEGGYTGAMAVLRRGDGPTIGVRVDIDGLPRSEADDDDHAPAAEGFRSKHEDRMHACGHDAHATIGVGVVEAIANSDFAGTLKVFFQPGEEMGVGGEVMAKSGHMDDIDYFIAVHIGLDKDTGVVVPGLDTFLAVNALRAEFEGEPAHAGGHPDWGKNAIQAMTTAVQNLYAIPRNGDGATRINAGKVGGGTATNIIPEEAFLECEVRGETTELMEYMQDKAETVIENAAAMHECTVDIDANPGTPSADCDEPLVDVVWAAAERTDGVTDVIDIEESLGSEDATHMMKRVQDHGGYSTYMGIGGGNEHGHHTARFDIDEEAIGIGVDVLTNAILDLSEQAA
ncbi:MAG: amidohydrolase [Halobacteriales archaeon]|nr:amidohydrolase [Halobacteriales archaeon]